MNCSHVSPPLCGNITFVATLTNIANRMTVTGGQLADITSTLTIDAPTKLNGRMVWCRGSTAAGTMNITNRLLNFTGAFMLFAILYVI